MTTTLKNWARGLNFNSSRAFYVKLSGFEAKGYISTRSRVIVFTDKQTDKQTNRQRVLPSLIHWLRLSLSQITIPPLACPAARTVAVTSVTPLVTAPGTQPVPVKSAAVARAMPSCHGSRRVQSVSHAGLIVINLFEERVVVPTRLCCELDPLKGFLWERGRRSGGALWAAIEKTWSKYDATQFEG